MVKRDHVLKKLVKEPNVAVFHGYVHELLSEPSPAAKVVHAEDLSLETELASQLGHVNRRRAEERAHFNDGPRPHAADEVLEHGTGGAPTPHPLRPPQLLRRVRRREVVKRRGTVEEAVDESPADGLRWNWIGAASRDSERVQLGGVNREMNNRFWFWFW